MGEVSAIAWTDSTFNPWIGCTKVSDGCKYCYAEQLMDKRYKKVVWGPEGERKRTHRANWMKPEAWNKKKYYQCDICKWRGDETKIVHQDGYNVCPDCYAGVSETRQRVFCASLADVFEDREELIPMRQDLFALIDRTPNLDWMLLTKRPENIWKQGDAAVSGSFTDWQDKHRNVWLGISAENQETYDERLEQLLFSTGNNTITFVSIEPMLGPVHIGYAAAFYLDWMIVGGESGEHCRPMENSWALKLMTDCARERIAFFMKQLGGHPNKRDKLTDFPEHLRVRQFPKKETPE